LRVFLCPPQPLQRDESGIVLILFALLIIPLLLVVAIAIDFSQTLVVKRQLTAAVDAAALTLGTLPTLDDAEAEAKAEDYIRAHYPGGAIGRLTGFSVLREGEAVEVSATAEIDTSFLRVAGYDTLTVAVNSRVQRKQNKLEVVMALDNTGSMGGWKIVALKDAANTLVDTLFGEETEAPAVKIGLVPFANAVNIGRLMRGTAIMDEATPAAINGEQITNGGTVISMFRVFDELGVAWGGCVRARTESFDTSDAPPTSADRRTLFTPYFAPDEPLLAWPLLSANNYFGIDTTPQHAFTHYQGRSNVNANGPNFNCPAVVQPLTNVKSTITTAIAAMNPNGQTVIPEGLAWGWRLISPGLPFTAGAPYDDQDTIKVVILLTDGDNDVNSGANQNGAYKSKYSAYGYAVDGHLGAVNGSQADAVLNQKTADVCANIKANKDQDETDQDIIVYTIVFDVKAGSKTETLMENCASDPGKYFNSPTASDLQGAFESIALGLNKLRVAR
jgi:Flp pilus assembly protein TadG